MGTTIEIINPKSESEIENYFKIRFKELRKPWGKPLGSEKDSIEDECIHRMLVRGDEYIGVARLQYNNESQAQIKYMAVKQEYQKQGFGKMLILDIEEIAKNDGIKEIILQSREVAIQFYKSLGYRIEKKTHLLFGNIQHFLMRKYL